MITSIRKIIFIYFLFSIILPNDRPKVALVLSGGGAKGIAQIPILEVIDSLKIPIDYVVGTSIGSINGALYSMGYSPDEILNIAYETKWENIFSNKKERKDLYYFQKNDLDQYQIKFTLKGIKPIAPIALTNGHASYMHLNGLTKNYEHIQSFNDFVIPFRCNAVDLLNGEEKIFNEGSLSIALRSSSSIPSVFSPVNHQSELLVDGGVLNNFPTDIAENLGADIIIGVDVSPIHKDASDINNVFDVLTQSILVNAHNKKIDNVKLSNCFIEPDVKSYGTLDFDEFSLNKLYDSGYKAVYDNLDKLIEISSLVKHNDYIKLSEIKSDTLEINEIIINSNDNITQNHIFKEFDTQSKISKNDFLTKITEIRNTNKYNYLSYNFNISDGRLILNLNIEKIPDIKINKINIVGNKTIKSSFIKELLNLNKGKNLDINDLRKNLDKANNLELFSSIHYELKNISDDNYDININVQEAPFHTMQLSGGWNNYHKLIGRVKFSLFNKPIKKFKFTNEFKFGNSIRENDIHMYYIGNFNYQTKVIPTIKLKHADNQTSYLNIENKSEEINIKNKNLSINAIIPLSNLGYIDIGLNDQKINYIDYIENLSYYNIHFNIDQINNLQYPTDGFQYKFYVEKSNSSYNYYIYKFNFDHYFFNKRSMKMKLYGDYFLSNLNLLENDELIYKNINYTHYDRTLSYSEYDLYVNDLSSYGIEMNYLYKNSTTVRLLVSHIESMEYKQNNDNFKNIINYGIGLRVKSILGPINFLWTSTNKNVYELEKDNYFFSLGINL